MSMYPWRAGEVITAHKLRSGVQAGVEPVTPDELQSAPALYSADYYRGQATVVFETPFASPPVIQVTARTSVPGDPLIEASYTDVTEDGFTIVIARRTTTMTNVDWIAIGEPA